MILDTSICVNQLTIEQDVPHPPLKPIYRTSNEKIYASLNEKFNWPKHEFYTTCDRTPRAAAWGCGHGSSNAIIQEKILVITP